MTAVGGSSADRSWRFPIATQGAAVAADEMVEHWNELHDGAALETLELELVRQIRTWRPEVLFTQAAPPQGNDPLAYVINQMVLKAATLAADVSYRPEATTALGLAPWKLRKVYGALPPGREGGELLASTQLAPELGCSLGQQAALARAIVCEQPAAPRGVLGFQLLSSQLPESASGRGFLGGVSLPVGGEARRGSNVSRERNGDSLRQLAVRQRNLQGILVQFNEDRDPSAVLAQLPEMIGPLGAENAAPLIFDLATRYHRQGNLTASAEAHSLLVERYPDHPLAAPATVWLIQQSASGEIALRSQSQSSQALAKTTAAGQVVKEKTGDGVKLTGFAPDAEILNPSGSVTPEADPAQRLTGRLSRSQALARLMGRARPTLAAEPAVAFPLGVLERAAQGGDVPRALRNLQQARPHDNWRRCLDAELWLTNKEQTPCPQAVWHCRRATTRPKLDGALDDQTWADADMTELLTAIDAGEPWPTRVVAAYDEKFLYVAYACAKAASAEYEDATTGRERDADLASGDRIELSIDIDRDYVTAWQLSVDHRGRVHDACWGDASWNPKWYVAATQDEDAWYVEAAIPLSELSSTPVRPSTTWAVSMHRVAPSAGEQSWPAASVGRTTFEDGGWLVFE
jgi:hypothetical protein